MVAWAGGDRTLKMLFVAKSSCQGDDAGKEQAAHTRSPKSSKSLVIAISFPELSLAFPMLKIAKMEAIVSHTWSPLRRCWFNTQNTWLILTVALATCSPTQTLCPCENGIIYNEEGGYLRPNPNASNLSSSFSLPFSSKNLSGLNVKGSGNTLSSCVMALGVHVSSHLSW